jgi:hypothetical protein
MLFAFSAVVLCLTGAGCGGGDSSAEGLARAKWDEDLFLAQNAYVDYYSPRNTRLVPIIPYDVAPFFHTIGVPLELQDLHPDRSRPHVFRKLRQGPLHHVIYMSHVPHVNVLDELPKAQLHRMYVLELGAVGARLQAQGAMVEAWPPGPARSAKLLQVNYYLEQVTAALMYVVRYPHIDPRRHQHVLERAHAVLASN